MLRTVLLLSLVVTGNFAAVCKRFPTVVALNLQQQIGNWGIHGIFGDADTKDPNAQCLHVELSARQFSQEPVEITGVTSGTNLTTGDTISDQLNIKVQLLAYPGRWQAEHNGATYDVSILHTDYVEYSLAVRCIATETDADYVYLLLSRSHNQMPTQIVENYRNFIQNELGENIVSYYQITHDHSICH